MSVRYKALLMIAEGLSDGRIAAELGPNPRTIADWRVKPEYQQIISDYKQGLADQIQENARIAAAHLRGVMMDGDKDATYVAIQALKAHALSVRAGAAKELSSAVAASLTPDEVQERRKRILSQVRVLDATGTDDG